MSDEHRLKAIRETLAQHGFEVTEEVAQAVYAAAMSEPPGPIYAIGDFVEVYQGMGEAAFGEVVGEADQYGRYLIDYSWGDGKVTHQSHGKPSGRATPEEALDYYLVRSGQKKAT